MNKRFAIIVAGVLSVQWACFAQSSAIKESEKVDFVPEEDRWQIDAGVSHRMYLHNRSALQNRADAIHEPEVTWEDGSSEGRGWGIHLAVSRGLAQINFDLGKSDLVYELEPDTGHSHKIRADRNDVELYWHEGRTKTERGVWGSSIGFKHIGVRQRIEIVENASRLTKVGATDWWMLAPGVFGDLRPFRNDVFLFHFRGNLLIGEASGIARQGHDDGYDGSIGESYRNERSLAYGVQVDVTASFQVTESVLVSIGYARELLYSFNVTEDEGMMVFPDNDDALFTENSHFWHIGIDWLF